MTENNTENPSIISHLSVGTNDFDRAMKFYDTVLETLGCQRMMTHPGVAAYGKLFPEFWVQTPIDGKAANVGNGSHVAFVARDEGEVHAFFKAAVDAGASPEGEPGPRPAYSDAYYGCFVRDLDGNKIEATYWNESKWDPSKMPASV